LAIKVFSSQEFISLFSWLQIKESVIKIPKKKLVKKVIKNSGKGFLSVWFIIFCIKKIKQVLVYK